MWNRIHVRAFCECVLFFNRKHKRKGDVEEEKSVVPARLIDFKLRDCSPLLFLCKHLFIGTEKLINGLRGVKTSKLAHDRKKRKILNEMADGK